MGDLKLNVRDLEIIGFRTLSIYITVCQTLNLTQAAELLALPKSTVSKEVSRLEEHLQSRLLERSTRKVSLTEAGKLVYERAFQLVEEFRSLRQDVQSLDTQVQGLLKLTAPPVLGEYLTGTLLADFMLQWPKITVALELSYSFDDLFAQGIDLGFRIGQIADDRLVARQIGSSSRILVASPEYLAKHPVIQEPQDLVEHNCLRFQYNPTDTDWVLTCGEHTCSIPVRGNFYCSNIEALKNAALRGLGITQLPVSSAREELEQGSLVAVLDGLCVPPMPIYLVYRSGVNKPRKLQALLDFIDQWVADGKFCFDQ